LHILPGPASSALGLEVAKRLNARVIHVEFKRFPDGESYFRLKEEVKEEDVAIIQTTGPPQDTNLIQLLLLLRTAKDLGAKSVTAVVPYFAYARQMRRGRSGECVSAEVVVNLVECVGADRFVTVNAHAPEILEWFKIPVENLSAITLLANFFKQQGLEGAFSFAPDDGALDLAKEGDRVLKGGYGCLDKMRDKITGEINVVEKAFNVKDRDVVVFDDIISTGATMQTAVKILKAQKARRVYAACVHPIFAEGAFERILSAGAEGVVGTDCVSNKVNVVSVAPIIVEALQRQL